MAEDGRLGGVIAAIDAANAADPHRDADGRPVERVCNAMSGIT